MHRDFEAILIFIKEKKKDFKGSFPNYTLPTFTTYKLFMISCSKPVIKHVWKRKSLVSITSMGSKKQQNEWENDVYFNLLE